MFACKATKWIQKISSSLARIKSCWRGHGFILFCLHLISLSLFNHKNDFFPVACGDNENRKVFISTKSHLNSFPLNFSPIRIIRETFIDTLSKLFDQSALERSQVLLVRLVRLGIDRVTFTVFDSADGNDKVLRKSCSHEKLICRKLTLKLNDCHLKVSLSASSWHVQRLALCSCSSSYGKLPTSYQKQILLKVNDRV